MNFVGTLGFSIVLPFLVYVVTRLGGNALVYGVTGATYSAFQLIGAPILGRWSDTYGRKRILLLSQAGTAVSWGVFLVAVMLPVRPLAQVDWPLLGAFTLTIPLIALFVARALDGITGGNISVANAYLADITSDADRAANFGRLAVSQNLGFIVGPGLAGLLGATRWGERAPLTAAFAISAVACVMIAVGLRESRPTDAATAGDAAQRKTQQKLPFADVARIPQVPRLLLLNLLVYLAFNFLYVAFPMYVARDLHWPIAATGTFFATLSLMMVAVQGPVLSYARKFASERALLLAGGVILAVSFPFFSATSAVWLYTGAALLSLGNGLMWPSLLALLATAAGHRAQGTVQGLAGSGAALASIIGLLAGGVIFDAIGASVFYVAAAITAVACGIALGVRSGAAPSLADAAQ